MKLCMNDGMELSYRHWQSQEGKMILLLVHGMAEHIDRYHEFAEYLNDRQVHVYAYDQRGHGKTAGHPSKLGYFGPGGWHSVVEDVKEVIEHVKGQHPDLPLVLMGHSMGSFVVRNYMERYGDVSGLVLSGTGGSAGIKGRALEQLAKVQVKLKGPAAPSVLIDKLTNATFMQKIKPKRTNADWLSRAKGIADEYIADPYCGTVFSTSFYRDLFSAVEHVNSVKCVGAYPKNVPIYLFSGDQDPVGDYGHGVKKVYDLLKITGQEDIDIKLYPGGRHEMLNETNKDEVYHDVCQWLIKRYL